MRQRSIFFGLLLAAPGAAQIVGSRAEAHGLPGSTPGSEQWLVEFRTRSFDLLPFREAMQSRAPATEVAAIVAKMAARVRIDQAPFVAAIEQLGGRVIDQWWLVNGCAIEIAFDRLAAVRALPNVRRVDPNELVAPAIKTATSARNHNSDAVNTAGHIGKGIAVAIIDTGLDSNCGGKNRPHRTFYEGGDVTKRNRLLANKQAGTGAADNPDSHGTGVAAVAAGGPWGTSRADFGHAPGADIVGYSLAGGSSLVTVTKAWQMVATDASAYNIKTANNSWSGSNDPQHLSQQALDSAAWNADIMVIVAAGNSGPTTTSSQACANGLAVGAVHADSYAVAAFSSRGPIASDPQRFYPDLCACGVDTVMPRVDNEAFDYVGSGTSMAAPQVCGAATLIRAANPKLNASETKAILLATALDVSYYNPNHPYNSRNAYGMGFTKDDAAIKLALDTASHGNAAVTSTSPAFQRSITVKHGQRYRFATAWMRQDVTSTAWSNLDLEILDGATVIASSKTPRNLYEVATFRAPKNGTLLARVQAPSIENGNQPFAWAFAEATDAPTRSEYELFGAGCPGAPRGCGVCQSQNWTQALAGKSTNASQIAILQAAGADGLNVCGVDFYARANGAALDVNVEVRLADSQTKPGLLLQSASMRVASNAGVCGARFPVAAVPKNAFYFVIFDNAHRLDLPVSPQGQLVVHCELTGSGWSPLTLDTMWQLRVHCDQRGEVPALAALGLPVIGKSFDVTLANARPSTVAALVMGLSDKAWGPIVLPWSFAAPCELLVSGELMFGLAVSAQGTAKLTVPVPHAKELLDTQVFHQYLVAEPANSVGWITSNGGRARIGDV